MTRFDTALEDFRSTAEKIVLNHYAEQGFTFAVPGVVIASHGKRFAKLCSTETREGKTETRSVHSFVEIETGDIFKPASFKTPAKHSRGNIYTEDMGASSLTPQGSIHYLR